MTSIRELLDEATRDVVADPHDAPERVRRGLRTRRQQTAAIAGVIAVVIAAIVVPLAVAGQDESGVTPGRPHPKPVPTLQHWAADDSVVTSGFGQVIALHPCAANGCKAWVDELDVHKGHQIARIDVPSPATQIAADLGAIWVLGGGGGSTPTLTLINAADTTKTYRVPLGTGGEPPSGIAFFEGAAWITFPAANKVSLFEPGLPTDPEWPNLREASISLSGGPDYIATTGHGGQIWVRRGAAEKLTRLVMTTPTADTVGILAARTVSWGSPIFSSTSPSKTILALGAGATVGTLEPSFLGGCSACAQGGGVFAKGHVNAVLQTNRGWWVTTTKRTYFYDHASLQSGGQPTASIPVRGASLAPTGLGVVIGSPDAGLFRWAPRGR